MHYHVWFVTKYREETLEGEREKIAKEAFLEVALNKKYHILEMQTAKDHAHMLLEARDRKELSAIVRTLKCVSAKRLLDTPHDTPCLPSFAKASEGRRMGNTRGNEGYHTRKRVEVRKNRAGIRKHFWARKYGWKEVSERDLESMRNYVRNQKRLHAQSTPALRRCAIIYGAG